MTKNRFSLSASLHILIVTHLVTTDVKKLSAYVFNNVLNVLDRVIPQTLTLKQLEMSSVLSKTTTTLHEILSSNEGNDATLSIFNRY